MGQKPPNISAEKEILYNKVRETINQGRQMRTGGLRPIRVECDKDLSLSLSLLSLFFFFLRWSSAFGFGFRYPPGLTHNPMVRHGGKKETKLKKKPGKSVSESFFFGYCSLLKLFCKKSNKMTN